MKIFENVAGLAAAHLKDGQIVETKGYTTAGDGGQARYLIQTAVQYAGTPGEFGDHTLANGNVAVLQVGSFVNALQFGVKGDGTTDNSSAVQAAVDYASASLGEGRNTVVIPASSTTYILSDVDIPANVVIKGAGKNATKLEPKSGSTGGYMLRLNGNHCGIMDIGFLHDRSFSINAIELFATAGINRWVDIHSVHIDQIRGSAIKLNNTLWESTFRDVHTRSCGYAPDDAPAFDIGTAAAPLDSTNNLTLDRCFIIFPHYYGVLIRGASDNFIRTPRIVNCMFHGGTSESDLTPLPYALIEATHVTDLFVAANRMTNASDAAPMVNVAGTSGNLSTVRIRDNEFIGESGANTVMHMRYTKDCVIGVNQSAAFTSGFHIDVDSTVRRLRIDPQNIDGGNPLRINGDPSEYQALDTVRLEDPVITGTPSIKGANNWAGEEAVSAATSIAVALPNTEPSNSYFVVAGSNFNSGHVYTTGKSTTGFTLNWPTSGTGVVWWHILR